MKKFLLSFQVILLFFVSTKSNAQLICSGGSNNCNIAASNIASAVTETSVVKVNNVDFCQKTTNVSFTLSHNDGIKYVNFYFFNNSFPPNFSCGSAPTSSVTNLGAYIALVFDNSTDTWSIYNTGINGTGLSPQTAYTLTATPITGGTNFVLTGVEFLSGVPCASNNIVLYIGGTNAQSNGIQCYNTSNFTPYLVNVTGKIDCGTQVSPLNYDLFIDANYQNPPGTAATITGTYQVFIDVNSNSIIDGTDINLTTPETFTTATGAGVPSGFTSRFFDFDNVIPLANGDVNSTKNLLVRVTPSTPGVASVTGILTNTCSTLPVSLKDFNVMQRNGKAELAWNTEQENNNDGFEVEKRVSSGQFVKVGFVDSKAPSGTGAAFSYNFSDPTILAKGVTYYRLKQIDLDGRFSYSEVKAVRTGNGTLTISVYPNPSRGMVNVTIPESNSLMDVSVDDYTGKSIQRWSGIKVQNMQINNLKPGVYMLRFNFRESGETITQRIVVQ